MTKQGAKRADPTPDAWTPQTLALGEALSRGAKIGGVIEAGGASIQARLGGESLWLVIRTAKGASLALRTAHAAEGGLAAKTAGAGAFTADSVGATFHVQVQAAEDRLVRVTTTLTPKRPLLIPFWPRDLYPLGPQDDPILAKGEVIAAQRGFNAGVCFFRMQEPGAAVLYFQNLTALNPWFEATDTKPDGVVGGQWPELGYQPPAAPGAPSPPERPLPEGQSIILSDAFLFLPETAPGSETEEAGLFLDGLAAIYPHIDKPSPVFRDWPRLARRTLAALERSPKVTVQRYGHVYPRPYTDAEVPDSMVHMALLLPIKDYGDWRGRPLKLESALRAGVGKFFDAELGAIRRYLPNVGQGTEPIPKAKDKDADEVDSWYLYHPLTNLGRLALDGDKDAERMFLGSLDFAITVARHFKYEWPVLFDVSTLKVHTATRDDQGHGQTDVGGLYAYVMLQAHALTGNDRFLQEAIKGVQATKGLGFELLYQTNLTAWGVMACLKLWKTTGDRFFLRQSQLFLAGFFHNTIFWESEMGAAAHYQTFLGATCLHDGPYMAIYECFESFAAFRDYLEAAGDEAPESVRLLLNEYCRYALSRAWGFYPGELPDGVPCEEHRNGEVDRRLALPMEDLYADGQPPGAVGQEVYGAGAAFIFTARAFHRRRGAPFTVFCDYPVREVQAAPGAWSGRIAGWQGGACRLRIIAPSGGRLDKLSVRVDGRLRTSATPESGVWEIEAPGRALVDISWER